jgi:hypothetical protein
MIFNMNAPASSKLQRIITMNQTLGEGLQIILPPHKTQHLIFPGGGVFFWWQAGTIQTLKETFDLKNGSFSMYGASAGSISSVLAACNVDMHYAMTEAFRIPKKSCGVTHAYLIELWLHKILPENCHKICSNGKVNISITTITISYIPLHRKVISNFSSKQDLIDACLTSSHIPFFMDGNFSRTFHGESCVDGSFLFFLHHTPWPKAELLDGNQRALMFFQGNDQELMKQHFSMLHALDQKSTILMFNLGRAYGNRLLKDVQNSVSHPRIHE